MHFIRELHHFSRKSLKGHYAKAFGAAMLLLGVWLVLKLVPVFLAGVLLLNGTLTPGGLFFGRKRMWVLFMAMWELLTFCMLLPVRCGTRSWFSHLTELEQPEQERQFFRNGKAYFRALWFFASVKFLRWLAAMPCAAACLLTAEAFRRSAALTEGGLWLFAAVQGIAAVFWAGWFYVRFCVSLSAVPYLFLENPKTGILQAVRTSGKMLSGRHAQLAALVVPYVPAAVPVVTIPFLLPCLLTDLTLYLQLRIREYEQAQRVESEERRVKSGEH